MSNCYIKSPLNYVGGKYKLLPQILPYFPEEINTFVDLFGGGFNVGINVDSKTTIYNDTLMQITDLLKYFIEIKHDKLIKEIDRMIKIYDLSATNKASYLQLREDYNVEKDEIRLYLLICHSFSNQIRFNSHDCFNLPFGNRTFNNSLREKLKVFVGALENKKCIFTSHDFREIDLSNLTTGDFVYLDPPYYNSVATYSENKNWSGQDESDLLELLDNLDKQGVKFALSNNLKYGNPYLERWKDKYNVHYLNADYNSCNYHKLNKSKDIEVLITNY